MITSKRIGSAVLGTTLAIMLCACPSEKKDARDNAVAAKPVQPAEQPQPVQQAQPAQPQQAAQASPLDQGKQLYLTGCANCHGPDGSGAMMRQMLPNIGDLTSPETHKRLSDDDIALKIAKGKDKMPPFESVFKPDQIKLIVAYVRTLKKG